MPKANRCPHAIAHSALPDAAHARHGAGGLLDRLLSARESALALLYPATCVLCGAPGEPPLDLCAGCRRDLPALGRHCGRCALPLTAGDEGGRTAAGKSDPPLLCGNCQRRPPPFERCHAPFRYAYPLPVLIGGLKFRRRLDLLRLMGLLLADSLQHADVRRPDVIVPVPLHRRRLRERGYNQALEIARIPSALLSVPVDPHCCERVIATPPQVGLDAAARRKNLRGAFRANRSLQGLRIAVLDDVVTTGGTVSEVSRVLLAAGAAAVDIWTLSRTP